MKINQAGGVQEIFEGEMLHGEFKGFGRYISMSASSPIMFVGWFDNVFLSAGFEGIYWSDHKITAQGLYEPGVSYQSATPTN